MAWDKLTVLVADDDDGCRDLFAEWLAADDHEVMTAPDGESALAMLSPAVDVVLLDREMPGLSGTAVAEAIEDGDVDPHVVMVSSAPVDSDLVEVPVDDYLRKPVEAADLRDVVREFRARQAYESALDQYFALTAKLAAIEADNDAAALAEDEQYQRLCWLVEEKRVEVDAALDRSRADWSTAFRTLAPDPGAESPPRRV